MFKLKKKKDTHGKIISNKELEKLLKHEGSSMVKTMYANTDNGTSIYLNLEFNEEGNIYEEYDELCGNGLLDAILDTFQEDYGRANAVLNMLYADMIENNNSISNIIGTAMSNISTVADDLIHSLSEKISEMNTNINNEDIVKLQNFLK